MGVFGSSEYWTSYSSCPKSIKSHQMRPKTTKFHKNWRKIILGKPWLKTVKNGQNRLNLSQTSTWQVHIASLPFKVNVRGEDNVIFCRFRGILCFQPRILSRPWRGISKWSWRGWRHTAFQIPLEDHEECHNLVPLLYNFVPTTTNFVLPPFLRYFQIVVGKGCWKHAASQIRF